MEQRKKRIRLMWFFSISGSVLASFVVIIFWLLSRDGPVPVYDSEDNLWWLEDGRACTGWAEEICMPAELAPHLHKTVENTGPFCGGVVTRETLSRYWDGDLSDSDENSIPFTQPSYGWLQEGEHVTIVMRTLDHKWLATSIRRQAINNRATPPLDEFIIHTLWVRAEDVEHSCSFDPQLTPTS